jgi:hypothetical protein
LWIKDKSFSREIILLLLHSFDTKRFSRENRIQIKDNIIRTSHVTEGISSIIPKLKRQSQTTILQKDTATIHVLLDGKHNTGTMKKRITSQISSKYPQAHPPLERNIGAFRNT